MDATVYTLTYVMGFVVTGVFVILFALLIVFQSAVRENHSKARRTRYPEEGMSHHITFSSWSSVLSPLFLVVELM